VRVKTNWIQIGSIRQPHLLLLRQNGGGTGERKGFLLTDGCSFQIIEWGQNIYIYIGKPNVDREYSFVGTDGRLTDRRLTDRRLTEKRLTDRRLTDRLSCSAVLQISVCTATRFVS
jgi:hypothetical protein